jgi:hypothetical protein
MFHHSFRFVSYRLTHANGGFEGASFLFDNVRVLFVGPGRGESSLTPGDTDTGFEAGLGRPDARGTDDVGFVARPT